MSEWDDYGEGFAGGPLGDEMAVALVLWPFWLVRWCWRKMRGARSLLSGPVGEETPPNPCDCGMDGGPVWGCTKHPGNLATPPARCPSCGSDDPKVRRAVRIDGARCFDAWHVSPKEGER